MKILLSAFIGSDNLGDETIAQIIIKRLASQAQLTVLTKNVSRTKKLVPDASFKASQANLSNLFKTLRTSDCLVLGGGGIINDESSVISLAKYYAQVFIAKRVLKKPVYLLFVGVGPLSTKLGLWLIKDMRRMISHALVRDKESAQILEKQGFSSSQITTAYDIAFNFPVKNVIAKPSHNKPVLLFCPRDWFFLKKAVPTGRALKLARNNPASRLYEFRNSLLKLVEGALKKNSELTIVAVPFYFSQDLDILLWIQNQLPKKYAKRYVVEGKEMSPAEFLNLAKNASAILGVRLHSLILGAVVNRSLIPLTYSEKVRNLINYLGLSAFTTKLESPEFDVSKTLNNIDKAVRANAPNYAVSLKQIQATNEAAFNKVISIINSGTKPD